MVKLISKDKIVKEERLDLNGCNKIIVKFSTHDVEVELTDDDKLGIVQLADGNFKEEEKFISIITDEVIEIKQKNYDLKLKVSIGRVSRTLKIFIPKNYVGCLDIKTSLGSININDGLKLDNLNIESGSGNFKCNNMLEGNEVSIKSTLGDVRFNEIAAKTCKLETTSGEINADSVNGDKVSIKSNLGNIKLNKIVADENRIEASSGNINIGSINGDNINVKSNIGNVTLSEVIITGLYNIETSSGKINIGSIIGSGSIGATLGNIDINYKEIKDYSKVKSTSGDVRIFVPKKLSFEFYGECSLGNIKSSFDINYKTRNGNKATVLVGDGPYKKLNVNTSLGNIHLNEK